MTRNGAIHEMNPLVRTLLRFDFDPIRITAAIDVAAQLGLAAFLLASGSKTAAELANGAQANEAVKFERRCVLFVIIGIRRIDDARFVRTEVGAH